MVGMLYFNIQNLVLKVSGFSPAAGLKSRQSNRERNYAILA
jgi:hypothetical protein